MRLASPSSTVPSCSGPIFRDQGWTDSPFNLYPSKGAYMWRDMERCALAEGLAFRRPSQFPRNGLHAARMSLALDGVAPSLVPSWVRAVFRANFERDEDIGDADALRRLAREELPSVDADALWETSRGAAVKEALRRHTEEARSRGLFGAPSFVVGDELYWGHDRLDAALSDARPR